MEAIPPELRTVLNGSFQSLAAIAAGDEEGRTDKSCPWCKDPTAVADWEHSAWQCAARETKTKAPSDPVRRRLAWPVSHDEKYNQQVFTIAEEVVLKTWKRNFGEVAYGNVREQERKDSPSSASGPQQHGNSSSLTAAH